jgi:hypothetical protein
MSLPLQEHTILQRSAASGLVLPIQDLPLSGRQAVLLRHDDICDGCRCRADIEECEDADASKMQARPNFVSIDQLPSFVGKKARLILFDSTTAKCTCPVQSVHPYRHVIRPPLRLITGTGGPAGRCDSGWAAGQREA